MGYAPLKRPILKVVGICPFLYQIEALSIANQWKLKLKVKLNTKRVKNVPSFFRPTCATCSLRATHVSSWPTPAASMTMGISDLLPAVYLYKQTNKQTNKQMKIFLGEKSKKISKFFRTKFFFDQKWVFFQLRKQN